MPIYNVGSKAVRRPGRLARLEPADAQQHARAVQLRRRGALRLAAARGALAVAVRDDRGAHLLRAALPPPVDPRVDELGTVAVKLPPSLYALLTRRRRCTQNVHFSMTPIVRVETSGLSIMLNGSGHV